MIKIEFLSASGILICFHPFNIRFAELLVCHIQLRVHLQCVHSRNRYESGSSYLDVICSNSHVLKESILWKKIVSNPIIIDDCSSE